MCVEYIETGRLDKYHDIVTSAPRPRPPHKVSTPILALLTSIQPRAYGIFIRKRSINYAGYHSQGLSGNET